jgi:putative flippase GtrA
MKREIYIFLIVGLTTVCIDLFVYLSLIKINLISIELSKGISFICGSVFAYFANCYWTFQFKIVDRVSIVLFFLTYASSLSMNVLINSWLSLLGDGLWVFYIAFIAATAASATLNFFTMKYFIFNKDHLK